MKKIHFFLFFCLVNLISKGQEKGDIYINPTIGIENNNLFYSIYTNNVYNYINGYITQSNYLYHTQPSYPLVYNMNFGYKLNNNFCLGIGTSYERFTGDYDGSSYVDNIDLFNIRFRALCYFKLSKTQNRSLYVGLAPGLSYWNDNYTGVDKNSQSYMPLFTAQNFTTYSMQWILGLTYSWNEHISLVIEGAVGDPYHAAIGLSYIFKKKTDKPEAQ